MAINKDKLVRYANQIAFGKGMNPARNVMACNKNTNNFQITTPTFARVKTFLFVVFVAIPIGGEKEALTSINLVSVDPSGL